MKLKVNLLELSSFLVSCLNYGNRRKIHKFAKGLQYVNANKTKST
jgi:hypothetical protein